MFCLFNLFVYLSHAFGVGVGVLVLFQFYFDIIVFYFFDNARRMIDWKSFRFDLCLFFSVELFDNRSFTEGDNLCGQNSSIERFLCGSRTRVRTAHRKVKFYTIGVEVLSIIILASKSMREIRFGVGSGKQNMWQMHNTITVITCVCLADIRHRGYGGRS